MPAGGKGKQDTMASRKHRQAGRTQLASTSRQVVRTHAGRTRRTQVAGQRDWNRTQVEWNRQTTRTSWTWRPWWTSQTLIYGHHSYHRYTVKDRQNFYHRTNGYWRRYLVNEDMNFMAKELKKDLTRKKASKTTLWAVIFGLHGHHGEGQSLSVNFSNFYVIYRNCNILVAQNTISPGGGGVGVMFPR